MDASLRYKVDDPNQLEALIQNQDIRQSPAAADADYFILVYADDLGASVISNDEYEQYQETYPFIEERRVPLMIIDGEVVFYEDIKDR